MQKYDRLGGLLWMAIGVAISIESIRLGPGSFSEPGSGFIPLGCGLLLVTLGLALSLLKARAGGRGGEAAPEVGPSWHKVVLALGYLVAYALLMDVLGFLLATLLWVSANGRLAKMGWVQTLLVAFFATLFSFVIFDYLLKLRLPRGIWGF